MKKSVFEPWAAGWKVPEESTRLCPTTLSIDYGFHREVRQIEALHKMNVCFKGLPFLNMNIMVNLYP